MGLLQWLRRLARRARPTPDQAQATAIFGNRWGPSEASFADPTERPSEGDGRV